MAVFFSSTLSCGDIHTGVHVQCIIVCSQMRKCWWTKNEKPKDVKNIFFTPAEALLKNMNLHQTNKIDNLHHCISFLVLLFAL